MLRSKTKQISFFLILLIFSAIYIISSQIAITLSNQEISFIESDIDYEEIDFLKIEKIHFFKIRILAFPSFYSYIIYRNFYISILQYYLTKNLNIPPPNFTC